LFRAKINNVIIAVVTTKIVFGGRSDIPKLGSSDSLKVPIM
jgi:hypothetical protein